MRKFTILFLPVLLILLSTCKKEKSNPCDATVAANLPAVAIDSVYRDGDKIIITGNVLGVGQDDAGLTAHGVVWSQNLTPSLQNGESKNLGDAAATGRFTVTLDSLPPGDYQFRTYATNCTGTQYSGAVKNLMVTVQGKPFVQVNDHYLITATGNDGIINPGDDVQYGFTVQNVGTLKADAVTATLYTAATQYIGNLSPASLNIGVLNAGGAISGAQTLSFKVAANTPPGQYCLNVDIDADGETNPDTICFQVVQKVVAGFTVQNEGCKAPCTVSFTNTSQGATSYVWDFGDGSAVSTETNPNHEYKKSGTYQIVLSATGISGTDKDTQTVKINAVTFITTLPVQLGNVGGGIKVVEIPSGYRIFGYYGSESANRQIIEVNKQGVITFENQSVNDGLGYTRFISETSDNSDNYNTLFFIFDDIGGITYTGIGESNALGAASSFQIIPDYSPSGFTKIENEKYLMSGGHSPGSFVTDPNDNTHNVRSYIIDFNKKSVNKIYDFNNADEYVYPGPTFKYNQTLLTYYAWEQDSFRYNKFEAMNESGGNIISLLFEASSFIPIGGAPALAGQFYIYGTHNYTDTELRSISVNGNILWKKNIPLSYNYYNNPVVTENGDALLCFSYFSNTLRIIKIKQNGTTDWQRDYDLGDDVDANHMIETIDGGFIITGRLGGRILLVKTDHEGNIN